MEVIALAFIAGLSGISTGFALGAAAALCKVQGNRFNLFSTASGAWHVAR